MKYQYLITALAVVVVSGCGTVGGKRISGKGTLQLISPDLTVEGPHMHMMGPASNEFFHFENPKKPELIWLKSFRTTVLVDGKQVPNSKLMCHNAIEKNIKKSSGKNELFQRSKGWFIGVSSSNHMETKFPDGYGVPISTGDQFFVNSQVTNDRHLQTPIRVQYKTEIEYAKDSELKHPPRPLYRRTLMALTPRSDGYCQFGRKGDRSLSSSEACPRQQSVMKHMGYHDSVDQYGQKFSSHWFAESGTTLNRTLVTRVLELTHDTKIHYVSAHVHPGVKSIKLVDLTQGKVIYETDVSEHQGYELTKIFSSTEGIPLFKGHNYEMVTRVENKSKKPIDIMAMLYIYMEDPNFKRL